MLRSISILTIMFAVGAFAGLVKRDTADDIGESLANMLDNDNPLEDLKEGGLCVMDSQCMEPLQYCNRENPLNMHCEFVVWVWVGLGIAAGVLILAVFGSCLCCSCCFLSSLCRKK